jgi:hypothetical protein
LSLSDGEIEALQKNGNVVAVEDDGEMYALEAVAPSPVQFPGPRLTVEDQPSPLAETIPIGVNQIKSPLGGTVRAERASRSRSSTPGSTASIQTSQRTTAAPRAS